MEDIIFLDNGMISVDVDAVFTFTRCKDLDDCIDYKVKAIDLTAAEIELLKGEYIKKNKL